MGMIFKDGEYDKGIIAKMNVPFTAGVGGEARTVYSMVHNAIAAKLRAETGATANRDEVENIARRFMPTLLDTDESARDKMTRLQEFMDTALDTVDPNQLFKRPERSAPSSRPGGSVSPAKQKLRSLLSK